MTQHFAILDQLKIAEDQNNGVAESRGVRSYKEVQETTGVVLHPSLGLNLSQAGCYLVDTEGDGSPHCVAVKVKAEQPECVEIFDGQRAWTLQFGDLQSCASECIDKSSLVTFRVHMSATAAPAMSQQPFPSAAEELLWLLAVGSLRPIRA
jgi:hypothetical protein